MNQAIKVPKWWGYSARFLLTLTVGVSFLCFVSFWSLHSSSFASLFAGIFGNDSLGQGLGIIATYVFSYYALSGSLLLAVLGMLMGAYLKYPLKEFVIVFVISLALVLFFNAYE